VRQHAQLRDLGRKRLQGRAGAVAAGVVDVAVVALILSALT